MEKLEAEVNRWRSGETVRLEEQVNLQEIETVTPVTSFIEEKPPAPVSVIVFINSTSQNLVYFVKCFLFR